ncbi:MAG TPA: hypothetical protein PK079_11175 [Leptospiraceae bacterium]|nr:hypothetical protein [Leptospiraceae bacterium]HMX31574.1 hypothetical protein [Leptospiraceae bacterium]HMY29639.1 hypothetical protein [Leptospiraceae bacterium]HMZ66179.1 hypothetical protein [Leptospiraceae bacterium]HNA09143.1 hypothetical protein [Leptospiraceae bacterium]
MKTEYIAHRINTVNELLSLPVGVGVELDLRDEGKDLILQHDPFTGGEKFETFLEHYGDRNTLILNIKSERIEARVLELVKKYNVQKYFFLDSSFPMIIQLIRMGEKNLALRFSEYETLDTILTLAGKVDWVWVDCFTKLPINSENYKILKDNGFKICLVSPELQGRQEDILIYKEYLEKENISFDAICTKIKNFPLWQKD